MLKILSNKESCHSGFMSCFSFQCPETLLANLLMLMMPIEIEDVDVVFTAFPRQLNFCLFF